VSTYDAITILILIAMSTVHSYLYLLDVRWTLIFNALNWYELENIQHNRVQVITMSNYLCTLQLW